MHSRSFAIILALLPAFALAQAPEAAAEIDFEKARSLIARQRSGETLTREESAYVERARLHRQKQPRQGGRGGSGQRPAPDRLTPLTDMSAEERYEGEEGGLYGNWSNAPPDSIREAAEVRIAAMEPFDASGQPSAEGKIALISISMSNATQEFSRFKEIADRSPEKSPRVVIVDCAQGGQAMAEWVPAGGRPWQVARERLAAAGVSPSQVQAAWVKLANKSPSGSLEDHGRKLESDTLSVLRQAKEQFPRLQVAYLGSRIWGGNARGALNPEPYAYESAFAARWLVQRQAAGDPELSLDHVPLLLWGPYLWAEGERGRQLDGLVWLPEDFAPDGVHPSQLGRTKVAGLLLDFFAQDPLARPWFTGGGPAPQ